MHQIRHNIPTEASPALSRADHYLQCPYDIPVNTSQNESCSSFATASHCQFLFSLWSAIIPKAFSAAVLHSYLFPIFVWLHLISPSLHLCSLNSVLLISDCASNVARSFWILVLSSKKLAILPRLVSSANFISALSIPSSKSLIKILTRIGPGTDLWRNLLEMPSQSDSEPLKSFWVWLKMWTEF